MGREREPVSFTKLRERERERKRERERERERTGKLHEAWASVLKRDS